MDNFDIPLEPQDPKPGSRAQFGCTLWSNSYYWSNIYTLGRHFSTVMIPFVIPDEQQDYSYTDSWRQTQDILARGSGVPTLQEKYDAWYGGIDPDTCSQHWDILGHGDYPDAYDSNTILNSIMGGLDSVAIERGTTIRFYKEKDFKGGIVLELTGPVLLNSLTGPGQPHYDPGLTLGWMNQWNPETLIDDGTKIGDAFPLEGHICMRQGYTGWASGEDTADETIPSVEQGTWAHCLGYSDETKSQPHSYLKNGLPFRTYVTLTEGSFKIRASSSTTGTLRSQPCNSTSSQPIQPVNPDTSQECSTKLTVSFDNVDHWAYKIADRSEAIVGSGNTANVSGLSPGTYNVQVRGLDSEGNEVARDNIITNVPGTYTANSTTDDPWTIERPVNVEASHTFGFNDFHARQRRVGNQEVWDWTQPGPPPPTPTPAPTSTPVPTATPMPTPTPVPVTGIDLEFYSGKYPYALHDVSYQHVIFWATVNITAPKNNLVKKDVEMVLAFGGRENSKSYWNIDTTGIEHQLDKTGDGIHPAVWIGFTNVGNSNSWFPAALSSQVSSPGGYNSWTMWDSGSHSQGFRPTGTGTFAWGLHRRTAHGIDNTIGLRLGIHSQNGSLGGSTYSNGTDRFSWSEFLGDDFIMHEIKDFSWPNSAQGFGWAFNCGPDTPTTQPYLKVEGVSVGNAGGQGSVPIHSTVSGL